jgi:16S rRNA processing protein RimM
MKVAPTPRQHENEPGSPIPGEPEFLVVGKLGKPHGIHGEIVMDVYTDFPDRLQAGVMVFVGPHYQRIQITKRRPHSRGLLLSLAGFQTREAVAELCNLIVFVRTADRPKLEEGEFYHHQLLGLKVIDEEGTSLGKITRILETGANDVYVVQSESGTEVLIPAIDSVILDIDLAKAQLRIHLLPGLLP